MLLTLSLYPPPPPKHYNISKVDIDMYQEVGWLCRKCIICNHICCNSRPPSIYSSQIWLCLTQAVYVVLSEPKLWAYRSYCTLRHSTHLMYEVIISVYLTIYMRALCPVRLRTIPINRTICSAIGQKIHSCVNGRNLLVYTSTGGQVYTIWYY